MRNHRLPVLLAGLALTAAAGLAVAQEAAPPAAYRPGLGDLMTMTVQPRHIKVYLAGKEANWIYAGYELHELQESFDRAVAIWPQFGTVKIAEMLPSVVKGPMADLDEAIKDQSVDKFNTAYAKLTQACNSCHIAANRPFVRIQVPDAAAYPDQVFKPKAPAPAN